jgi:hypothetical protein
VGKGSPHVNAIADIHHDVWYFYLSQGSEKSIVQFIQAIISQAPILFTGFHLFDIECGIFTAADAFCRFIPRGV